MTIKRIALVAGETSGDILGANLIKSLKQRYPEATFEGIGGPLMTEQGIENFEEMERLSVMGLVEVLGRLRELLKLRKSLIKRWLDSPPDLFIGIDAPDFNLGLEHALKEGGIPTVHYVSPSVWAWRQKRVFKIAKAVDLMLTLFPFEAKFYQKHNVEVQCVGHTLADQIAIEPNVEAARERFQVMGKPCIAVLPGSRSGEVSRLMPVFAETMDRLQQQFPDAEFLIPAANDLRKEQIEQILSSFSNLNVQIIDGQSREVMTAADSILIASGTATLEAALLKKPMVVSYKVNKFTAFLLRRMLKQDFVSLPNLLEGKELVPEILQEQATPENLSAAITEFLQNQEKNNHIKSRFLEMHKSLKLNAGETAADAIEKLLGISSRSPLKQVNS